MPKKRVTRMTKAIQADLYDFTDTSDLPADLQAALNKERSGRDAALMEAVVSAVVNAPSAVGIKTVMAVLNRMKAKGLIEVDVPTENTVRNYLNEAREQGKIGKPSRQTYWTAESDVEDVEAAPAEAEAPAADEDVLNDI